MEKKTLSAVDCSLAKFSCRYIIRRVYVGTVRASVRAANFQVSEGAMEAVKMAQVTYVLESLIEENALSEMAYRCFIG